ncbi:alpha,alpha-phosphotrehalase [Salisediminibacterium halotolerans]|uniref:alpha,alpha-phosphotrehalase n=1 Tax=Salisediminibacterium halotolerans TaxID=517425 RepID=UPI000F29DC03|nr:alpha,alpha-phosphotrehalase [Salisediminibacterium halotolerans]RLJ69243.1 trehalose-6-phosphate hydrolase [Actinophytocola xinjiangensis]RPE87022.1 trehalose-6-phosphate hydrolase [Salisediminibacterium halotolerans]TWG32245.1 trehalose-6-phosphate hydrolase [Salisediminibacterium halotolerans]GEL09247.1 trehalose-6-phosphate hydrolase [Salisediminibacterium halotolerans]
MEITMNEWWRRSVVYQIYPRSFNDTTGNGIGDIPGIIEKLDYLKELGVDVIWLTPVYASPQNDNGYDISDYFSIHHEFGTMEDFDRLLKEAHSRGLKIIMDLVVNHTSTEHQWFKESLKDQNNPYRSYYIWKEPVNGGEPTNWQSKFGGNAWEFDETTGEYYLHLFDVTQADLNWENPDVRKDIYDMMHFWFEKGIDGFRLDVINLISKDQRFPNDDGSVPPGDGRKFYTDGPRVHEFLNEMNREVLSDYDVMTVGEMSSTTIDDCIKYTRPDRNELNMTFNFHHLKVDYPDGEKWAIGKMDFHELKRILSEWQTRMHEGGGWNALFWCNHDQPRVVTRYGDDGAYHQRSAKMLATTMHMMQGTPYIYQGEEFGMTDPKFESIDDFRDVETLNMYKEKINAGVPEDEILRVIQAKSRDNSRTPVQWDSSRNAGFSDGEPWIPVAPNYEQVNAEQALNDPESIFYYYQKLIRLRKEIDILTYGDYTLHLPEDDRLFVFTRSWNGEKLLVISHFYEGTASFNAGSIVNLDDYESEMLIANTEGKPLTSEMEIGPYESIVYHLTKA